MARRGYIDIRAVREELGLSQTGLAERLGVSPRVVQSCEQGWRNPSPGVEKAALLLLMGHRLGIAFGEHYCWVTMGCTESEKAACPVYSSRQGHLCWLMTGNVCQGKPMDNWESKMDHCLRCAYFRKLMPGGVPLCTPSRGSQVGQSGPPSAA